MTNRIARTRLSSLLALALVTLTGAFASGDEGRWVGTWAASPQLTEPGNMPPEPGFADFTLRQVIHVSLGDRRRTERLIKLFDLICTRPEPCLTNWPRHRTSEPITVSATPTT
jgi:hypothetical protein